MLARHGGIVDPINPSHLARQVGAFGRLSGPAVKRPSQSERPSARNNDRQAGDLIATFIDAIDFAAAILVPILSKFSGDD